MQVFGYHVRHLVILDWLEQWKSEHFLSLGKVVSSMLPQFAQLSCTSQFLYIILCKFYIIIGTVSEILKEELVKT